uniref:HAUS augmin-like complex subunit 3 N-terminal domain-containing protein n=1 Tax=Graphocephala atropunctata TaxID=36148 RepID=A0A1B6LBL6_9HEMI
MTSTTFKEKMLELLSSTGYGFNVDHNHLSALDSNEDLKPFLDWFTQNISRENCLTREETEEFRKLEDSGKVLYGKELKEAVQTLHNQPVETLLPIAESNHEVLNDELAHLKEQLRLKEELHTVLQSSVSAATEDITSLREQCRKAETKKNDALKDVFAENKKLSNKLHELMTALHNVRENLSELHDHGSEISIDEGIDTYHSDKPGTSNSSFSSVSSLQQLPSTSSGKNSDSKYLFQLSLHKYEKINKHFNKIMDSIIEKGMTNLREMEGKNIDKNMDPELELHNIMDRLHKQKKAYIDNLIHLEGIKAAHEQVKEVCKELENRTWKPTSSELRKRLLDFNESSIDMNDSRDRNDDVLNETCAKWADLQTLRPIRDQLTARKKYFAFLMDKMDEVINALKVKKTVDDVFCELLHWEEEQIQMAIKTYLSVQCMLREWLEAVRERLDMMAVNIRDYADHCSLPVDERSELVKRMAQMLGSDTKCVPEAVRSLTEHAQNRHQTLSEHTNQQLQIIMSVEQNMKDFYYKELCDGKVQDQSNPETFSAIQRTLADMTNEIEEITQRCQSMQVNEEGLEDEKEVQDMLNKLIQSYQSS